MIIIVNFTACIFLAASISIQLDDPNGWTYLNAFLFILNYAFGVLNVASR